jgi:hypothetical protein
VTVQGILPVVTVLARLACWMIRASHALSAACVRIWWRVGVIAQISCGIITWTIQWPGRRNGPAG